MTSYNKLSLADGVTVRVDQVRRDDGANVLTGLLPGRSGEAVPVEGFDDADGLAYQAWLKAGGKLGDPLPKPREATSYDLVSVLSGDEVTALGKAKPKDQHLFGKRNDAWPEANEKIARLAAAIDMTPKAWFDRVFAPAAG